MTQLQSVSKMDQAAVWAEAPLASVYSFVPAGGALHDRRVTSLTRRLVEAIRAHLETEGDPRSVRLADFEKEPGACVTAEPSTIVCADLSQADTGAERLTVGLSEAVFVVSSTDAASLYDAREKAARLRAIKRDDCYGLLLLPSPGGVTLTQAEDITGLPVCALLRQDSDVALLARWLVQE